MRDDQTVAETRVPGCAIASGASAPLRPGRPVALLMRGFRTMVRAMGSPASSWTRCLVWPALLAAILLARVLAAACLPVMYPESAYIEYSRFLSAGYAESPPLIAWLIRLCAVDNPLGPRCRVRVASLILGASSYVAFAACSRRLFPDESVSRSATLLFLALPVVNAVGVLAVPHSALLCFGTLFLLATWEALQRHSLVAWLVAGGFLGLALLAEAAGLIALAGVVCYLLASDRDRHWLFRKEPYVGLALAVLVVSPFLDWNLKHGNIGLLHQAWYRYTPRGGLAPGRVGEFLGEQLAATGVLLSWPLVACLGVRSPSLPEAWRAPFHFARVQALVVLAFFLVCSPFLETHPQTTLLAFPSAAMCAAACLHLRGRNFQRSVRLAAWITLLATLIGAVALPFGLAVLQHMDPAICGPQLAAKVRLAQDRLFGWESLERQLDQQCGRYFPTGQGRLFTHSPQLATMVSLHHAGPPVVNLVPLIVKRYVAGNSQEHYLGLAELRNASGIYFGDETGLSPRGLQGIFDCAEELAPIDIRCRDRVVKRYRVWLVRRLRTRVFNSK
jgi:hypothetical protein